VTVRTLLAVATKKGWIIHQLDVNNAFLHGDLDEEVYMKIPKGFAKEGETRVCRLRKSLYGLKQASRNGYKKLTSFLLSLNFEQSKADYSLFTYQKAAKTSDGLVLSQRKYILDILKDSGMLGCWPSAFPFEQGTKLDKGEEEARVDATQYRRLVGRLLYLQATRPDVTYAVNVLSQFVSDPRQNHLEAAKRVLRYLKGTSGQGILLPRKGPTTLNAYYDSDWLGCPFTRRSRTGYLLVFSGGPISWKTKKQSVVSRSSTEAEYRAIASTVSEILWTRDIETKPIESKLQLADLLTKGLGTQQLHSLLNKMGIRIIHETTAPYTLQQNGVAERKNRALKEIVNSMLSYLGLSEGFWGKAMLTACYLLNRVPNKRNKTNPYELWYKKRPNLSYLRVWVCRAVVRLSDSKRKTLGEKGIDCIFVKYVEHSKAYRFYVIEPNDSVSINSIIESRDAIFDENRFSSIPRPKDIIPNSDEAQRDDHFDDVPSETLEPRKGLIDLMGWRKVLQLRPLIREFVWHNIGNGALTSPWFDRWCPNSPLANTISTRDIHRAGLNLESRVCDIVQDDGWSWPDYLVRKYPFLNQLVMPNKSTRSDTIEWRDETGVVKPFSYVYRKFDDSDKGVIICLYFDDILIFGTDQNQVDKTKKFLSLSFSTKDMGEADIILGIKIKRENKGIVITQSHYIEKILKKFNREDCSLVSTPIDPIEKLRPNTGKPVDQLEYSRAIFCLMYAMTSTRPDIAYAVGRLSRFTSNASRQHWQAIKRVFKYLKATMNYGLSYVGNPSVLEGYPDASWINHVEDSSSTSGCVFLLGEVPFHGLSRSKHTSLVLLWNMSL
nr:hypothetical protein [Tanacetum cinerariifolium]